MEGGKLGGIGLNGSIARSVEKILNCGLGRPARLKLILVRCDSCRNLTAVNEAF